jgi:hypothetical protein
LAVDDKKRCLGAILLIRAQRDRKTDPGWTFLFHRLKQRRIIP